MRYEKREDAAWLTLDRPGSANALTRRSAEEAARLVGRAAEEDSVAVLTGAGEKFCAGGDLGAIADIDDTESARDFASAIVELLREIETADVPVIAAVNGDAYGAGLELVVACDLAVAAEGARFGTPAARMGVQPPLLVERAAEVAGRKRVSEIALTGEAVDAPTAAEWGLVNTAVPDDELEDAASEVAASVAETDADAAHVTKERISGGHDDYEEIEGRMAERLAAPETRRRFREAAREHDSA